MNKKFRFILISVLLLEGISLSFQFLSLTTHQDMSFQSNKKPEIHSTPTQEDNTSYSIILLIGDGMGVDHIKFGYLVEYGINGTSSLFKFPYNTTISTTNIDGWTTDSAAAATAIACGVKTRNGRIAQNWNGKIDLPTILEIAKSKGYKTGLVATSHLTHATPACFAAHERDRSDYTAIAADFLHTKVDVMLGGGSESKYLGETIPLYQDRNYSYISTKDQLSDATNPVLGLFSSGSFPKNQDLTENHTIPSLSEMTAHAIRILNQTRSPYFLMIEASQIDWASHDNDPVYLAHQMIEFEKTVRFVKNIAENDESLQIIVTADHETGGFSFTPSELSTSVVHELDSFSVQQQKRTQRSQEIKVSWKSSGHTKNNVLLAGMGPYTEEILNATHHIDTFHILHRAIDGTAGKVPENIYRGNISYTILIVIVSVAICGIMLSIFAIKHKHPHLFKSH